MDCWEALYIQVLHHKQVLVDEQQIGDSNPLFQMANITYTPQKTKFTTAHASTQHTSQTHKTVSF